MKKGLRLWRREETNQAVSRSLQGLGEQFLETINVDLSEEWTKREQEPHEKNSGAMKDHSQAQKTAHCIEHEL